MVNDEHKALVVGFFWNDQQLSPESVVGFSRNEHITENDASQGLRLYEAILSYL